MKVGITNWTTQNDGKTQAAYLCDSSGNVVDTIYCEVDNPSNQWTHSNKPVNTYSIEWDEE